MYSQVNTWALILAAGDGVRLRSLTTAPSGLAIPKQFCSLRDGPSLLHEALGRARAVTCERHTCAVVAESHRLWWEPQLRNLPAANVIAQSSNRGTAHGILLPLLHIIARDPDARLLLLPSDHHVRKEAILGRALRQAVAQLQWRIDETVLLGLQPAPAGPELGYILPGPSDGRGALTVRHFIEKPTPTQARELIERSGLWNTFIVASTAQALLDLFRRRIPEIVREMRAAVQHDLSERGTRLATALLYEELPVIDFSHDILQGQEDRLRVLPVPQCGWSDLGTPERVADALRWTPPPQGRSVEVPMIPAQLSLAAQHARFHGAERCGA